MSLAKKSFIRNYLHTYFWQGIAIFLNLTSMLVVIPMITNNKVIYGVYSICISTAMFLNYADLGFVSASIKYAGECYASSKRKEELQYFGLSGFILFIFVSIISGIYILFSYYPSLLIKDFSSPEYLSIATKLLIIQAIFSFSTVLQRYISGVFQVRIESFIYQRINLVGSLLKIASVFFFFSSGRYDIVGYFLFSKLVEFVIILIGINIINRRYKISFIDYIKEFRFNKSVFIKTKDLAFSSLFVTFMWILYYELDLIIIGKLISASAVAIYALAFTLTKFIRSLSSTIFSPFQNRYNHLIGLGEMEGLKVLLYKVILYTMPIFVFFVLSVIVLSENIVLSWAGDEYLQSKIILSFLAANFMLSFIRVPGANMLVALKRIKDMYWINFIVVIVFWSGVLLTKNFLGVNSFAIFKFVAGIFAMIFYFRFLIKFLNKSITIILRETLLRMIIPIIVIILFLLFIREYLPDTKGKMNLITVIATGGVGTFLGFLSLYFSSKYYKQEINYYLLKILTQVNEKSKFRILDNLKSFFHS
jgi:O-antigen/teichoic acid export membrane protein